MNHLSALSQYTTTVNVSVNSSSSATNENVITDSSNMPKNQFAPGDIIQGEVIGIDEGQVRLALIGKQIITAHLEQEIDILTGQKMLFSVKGSNDSQITLSPLFENVAKQETASASLKEANLPVNENTLKLVSALMDEGMSIDRNMLIKMNRNVNMFSETPLPTLIKLAKMEIPITNENIQQFEAYMGNRNQIVHEMQDLLNGLPDTYQQMLQSSSEKESNQIIGKIFETIVDETNFSDNELQIQDDKSDNIIKNLISDSDIEWGETQNQKMQNVLKELDFPQETIQKLNYKDITGKQALQIIADAFELQNISEKQAKGLLKSDIFNKLIKGAIEKQWTIEPTQVDEKAVSKLYERLQRQTQQLEQILQASGQDSTVLAKSVQNLKANVDFINYINHMVPYVQLPLKFAADNSHGDLYVYTNKKSLAKNGSEVSALLHLDMEYLGTLDVHILLQNGDRVSTQFRVQDEETLEFISQHIDKLNEALKKKGYSTNISVEVKEGISSIMQEIISNQDNHVPVTKYSFDARA